MSWPPGGWNPPPPPPPPQSRPIRARRVFGGIGIALAAHLVTILPMIVALSVGNEDVAGGVAFVAMLAGQALVFLGCLIGGIVLTTRQDGGIGTGLLVGWAVGLLITPVVGFGICLVAYSAMGTA